MSTQSTALPLPPSTFTYRQLGPAPYSEPQFGQGTGNYLQGSDAVAQAVMTRLLLFEGEWWESVNDGTPIWQQILGVPGPGGNTTLQQQIALLLQNRILSTPYVTGITSLQFSFDSSARSFQLSASIATAFGVTQINYGPSVQPQALPGATS
jgi:hypothetical protein